MAGGSSNDELTDNDFKNFIISNGVVTAAVAITIGIATASFVKSIVSDIMMPIFYIIVGRVMLKNLSKAAFAKITELFADRATVDLDSFFKDFLTWVFIILGAYLLLNFVVNRWFLGKEPIGKSYSPSIVPPQSNDMNAIYGGAVMAGM